MRAFRRRRALICWRADGRGSGSKSDMLPFNPLGAILGSFLSSDPSVTEAIRGGRNPVYRGRAALCATSPDHRNSSPVACRWFDQYPHVPQSADVRRFARRRMALFQPLCLGGSNAFITSHPCLLPLRKGMALQRICPAVAHHSRRSDQKPLARTSISCSLNSQLTYEYERKTCCHHRDRSRFPSRKQQG